ncbi:MAG: sugar phosphate isomerase/epimerase [Lachnospiraceae bacterium]|nr:sugar phosphate isomerase/epimerase [Lachnospiraceae bacterium]
MLKLAVSTLTFDGFGNHNFVKTFAHAKEAGYERIEFNCWYPQTLTPENMRVLKRRCEESGFVPISLHVTAFGGGDNASLTMNVCHKIRAMEAAVELGCRRVVASCSARDTDGGLEAVIEELRILAPVAAELDVLLCLENHCQNVLEYAADYRQIFQVIHTPHVGICIDTGHFDAAGVDPLAIVAEFADKINHIHLKENDGFGAKKFCRFGTGTTDNVGVIKQLLKQGYAGYMSVELSPEIGETGAGIDFGMEDWKKPFELFSPFEIE